MGDKTGIEWTDHTFNPWWGCARVSPACEHCYAETFAARWGVKWGVKADRRIASEKVWNDPLRWDRAAEKAGVRRLVFCASMADVFEDRRDLDEHRARVFDLVQRTPHLDWQLLTKRIEHVRDMVPAHWMAGGWPGNAWIGTTVEDQRRADERITDLLALPAPVRFLSCEPLLGPVDISLWLVGHVLRTHDGRWLRNTHPDVAVTSGAWLAGVDWVIAGGESGPGARPMHPDWARSLRDQCRGADVPFFFKQWGDWAPRVRGDGEFNSNAQHGRDRLVSLDGVESCFVETAGAGAVPMSRVGKKSAGSLLDGREHKAFPGTKGA